MELHAYLDQMEALWDPEARMPCTPAGGPGYHTRIPRGTPAHETRGAGDYAIALLQDGSPERVTRAAQVLDALVAAQVTDPTDQHYGIWGWFLEEPPSSMAPADWNWADFIGIRLAHALVQHGAALPEDVRERTAGAARHAALSIFRRNVRAGYTNIAIMGAVTAAGVGEVMDLPFLRSYGLRRIQTVRELLDREGGFGEYNSPTYTRVAIEELERAHLLVTDPELLAVADELRGRAWDLLAERFHPATSQLAGPMSRAYSDWLPPALVTYLRAQTGADIRGHGNAPDEEPHLVPALSAPASAVERFHRLPAAEVEVRSNFGRASTFGLSAHDPARGTSWLTEDACLGSVNEAFAWVQRRPVLGYWATADAGPVALRARAMLNGHDLSAAFCRQEQVGPRLLSAWWLTYDSGDFHPGLDRPADSIFEVTDLRLRVSLEGVGTLGEHLAPDAFALVAGSRRAVVHAPAGGLGGVRTPWTLTTDEQGSACVDLVLHSGSTERWDLHGIQLQAAFGLELLRLDQEPSTAVVQVDSDGERALWTWGDLSVQAPAAPLPFVF